MSACKHETGPQPATPTPNSTGNNNGTGSGTGTGSGSSGTNTSICFERDVLPIFISNCAKAGCHDASTAADGYVFTSYANIVAKKFVPGNPGATELYEKITEDKPSDIMPPPPAPRLTSAQIATIGNWISQGAPNSTGCASLCDTSSFTFSAKIQPMLNQYCTGCHSGPTPSGGIALNSYAGTKLVVDRGRLLGAIRHQPGFSAMPQGGAKLSDCQIRLFEKWVGAGAPNN
jgi:hypothetical protein